jgi:ZIP family zinc transporter
MGVYMKLELILSILLITMAGLSTVIGSIIIFISKNKSHKKLGFLLGLAAGVMICLCIKELLPESQELLSNVYDSPMASIVLLGSLLLGFLLSIVLDKLIHHGEEEEEHDEHCHMCNIGVTAAFTMALHKLPEGIAIFIAIYDNYLVAVPLALAIAIHHIPEGMIVSAPIYYATGDKKKALLYSIASGLVLPVSGIIGFLFLQPLFTDLVEGIMLAVTSSIMFYITFKEIMPSAIKYGDKKTIVFSLTLGIIFIYLIELI